MVDELKLTELKQLVKFIQTLSAKHCAGGKKVQFDMVRHYTDLLKKQMLCYLERQRFSGSAQRELYHLFSTESIALLMTAEEFIAEGHQKYIARSSSELEKCINKVPGVAWVRKKMGDYGLNEKDKIIIYGAGRIGTRCHTALLLCGFKIVAFADSDVNRYGLKYHNLEIISPSIMRSMTFDKIIVASAAWEDVSKFLWTEGYIENEDYLIYRG